MKLLQTGHAYLEVGTPIAPRAGGRTKARALLRLRAEVRRESGPSG